MAIRRNISVLNQGISSDIDIVYGTDLVPIEFYITDYSLPDNAIATLYCTTSDNESHKNVGEIANNVITFNPVAGFFSVGKNKLQIRITADEKNLFSFESRVNCKSNMVSDDAVEVGSQPTLVTQLLTEIGNAKVTTKEVKEGLEKTKTQDVANNIVTFESYDNAEVHETILEVETISPKDTLGVILSKITKFTNNIRYILEQIKANLTFSTEEIKTGETWIDGKPIYRKTFVFTDTLSSPTTEIPHNIENVDKIWVDTSNSYFHQGSSYYPVTFAQYPSGLDAITTLVSTVNMVFNVQSSWGTAWQKVITLRYTKTTDKYL